MCRTRGAQEHVFVIDCVREEILAPLASAWFGSCGARVIRKGKYSRLESLCCLGACKHAPALYLQEVPKLCHARVVVLDSGAFTAARHDTYAMEIYAKKLPRFRGGRERGK